jgi:Abnormal spindle-like microcephaly-assoc'd, ASPM-SPD-2-Hydin
MAVRLLEAPVKDVGTHTKFVTVLFAFIALLGCGAVRAQIVMSRPTGIERPSRISRPSSSLPALRVVDADATPVATTAIRNSNIVISRPVRISRPIKIAVPTGGLLTAATVVDFGVVPVGTTAVRTNTIANTTKSPIVLESAQINQTDFTITNQQLPLTLAPGQRAIIQLAYTPKVGGSSQGRVVLASNVTRLSSTFALRGTAIASSRLSLTPSSLAFGKVVLGKAQAQSVTLSNPGRTPVVISRVTVSGSGFALSPLNLPMTLPAGQSVRVGITFTPAAGGSTTGSMSVVSMVSFGTRRPFSFSGKDGGGRNGERQADFTPISINIRPVILNVPLSGTGMGAGQLAISPSSIALGRAKLGATLSRQATLMNTGSADVTVKRLSVSGKGFNTSGLTLPLVLGAGQRKNFTVSFTAQSKGTANGSIVVTSDDASTVASAPVTADATAPGSLLSNPASINFGSATVGHPETQSAALTNNGGSNLTVSQASVSGSGYTISGLNLPLTLAPGQNAAFSVTLNPQAGSSGDGSVSFTSDAGALSVPLASDVISVGQLNSAPGRMNFGSVQAGTPKTLSGTLTNSGASSVSITQANLSGTGFSLTGLSLPVSLGAGQSTTFSVTFTPQSSGAASGSLVIASNATNSTLNIPLSATVASAGVLSTSDSSLTFGNVQINGSATQPETLTNSGGTTVTISQAKVSGTGFSATGLTLPMTLSPGQSFTFGTVFNPASGGSSTGSIVVTSDASNSTLTISLDGTATVPGQLLVSPASLSFGSVTVGQGKALTASLTAKGSSITISNAGGSTSEFVVSGISLPLTLKDGQSASFTVTFTPQSSGSTTATDSFTSNASNASLVQPLSGTGAAAPQHNVALSWNASASSVVGYNVYRSSDSGASFAKIASMNADLTYIDSAVQAGKTYLYVTTAVDANGKESGKSNQTQAAIPTP